jgi:hypothetical protein
MRARSRGIALVDFIAGTVMLAGAVTAWVALTRAQLDSVAFVDRRQQARNACARALDDARSEGVEALTAELGKTDANGFALIRRFPVHNLPSTANEPAGRLEARPLKTENAWGCWEVRAVVRWKNPHGADEAELSTILGAKK